jgi:hypothetical protein
MSTETDGVYSTGYMTISVTNLSANTELAVSLNTPGFAWDCDAKGQHWGLNVMGQQYAAFPLMMNLETNFLTLVLGDEGASFDIGIPITYPRGTHNPIAKGTLSINDPGNVTVFMSAGGPMQPMTINATWQLPII